MRKLIPLLLFALVALLAIQPTQADDSSNYKQLAAPASEITNMRLPNASENGVRSHSAMIPINFDGLEWQGNITLESAETAQLIAITPSDVTWDITLTAPSGTQLHLSPDTHSPGVTAHSASFGIANNSYPGTTYSFAISESGRWNVAINAIGKKVDTLDGYLVSVNREAPYKLYTHLGGYELLANRPITLQSYAFAAEDAPKTGSPTIAQDVIHAMSVRLIAEDGSVTEWKMTEDGNGVHSVVWNDLTAGNYVAQVAAQGINVDGTPFVRTSETLFPVIDDTLALGSKARVETVSDSRLQINLDVDGGMAARYLVSAELWGHNGNEIIPVAWVGGITQMTRSTLPISVDAGWLALTNVDSGLQLRNVRVQDTQTHIPVAQSDLIELSTPRQMPDRTYETVTAISDEMLMGARPTNVNATESGKLLLVHGYCSGSVWPTSHFSNYSLFQDYDQNRTHDQFAQLISSHGSQFSSFGVVAHSQGGAASTHLYTYYWSGLDYSSGNRLIQSVGTPYQGTSLAGNLALLGQIFGVGCGTNWDLTYDGASLWLSGIPSWARDDVYYATTSFKDRWWSYDYCNIASDIVLSDPDDGTTEKWSGQLSGANNLGHKTGWCHTAGMRDPAQATDYSRNVNMNANANR